MPSLERHTWAEVRVFRAVLPEPFGAGGDPGVAVQANEPIWDRSITAAGVGGTIGGVGYGCARSRGIASMSRGKQNTKNVVDKSFDTCPEATGIPILTKS